MSLLFLEGFDNYSAWGYMNKKWDAVSISSMSTNAGRFGSNGIAMNTASHYMQKNLGLGTKTTLVVGFAMRLFEADPIVYSSGYPLLRLEDEAGVVQVRLHLNDSYGFDVYNGAGTLLGSSADTLIGVNRWYYIEIKAVIHDTTGSVEVHLGESQILNLTSKDTKNGSAYVDRIRINCVYSNVGTYFDDVYIDDANFHGDCHVKTFRPDADGNSSDFTRSTGSNDYECVDEQGSNEDTDYIYSDTLNHKSIFGITTGALGTVEGVQLNLDCRLDEAGSRKITPICRSNSVDYSGSESDLLGASYIYELQCWDTDPDDSGAWTQTKLEAAEFGLEITT
jgi:hypothetical protein